MKLEAIVSRLLFLRTKRKAIELGLNYFFNSYDKIKPEIYRIQDEIKAEEKSLPDEYMKSCSQKEDGTLTGNPAEFLSNFQKKQKDLQERLARYQVRLQKFEALEEKRIVYTKEQLMTIEQEERKLISQLQKLRQEAYIKCFKGKEVEDFKQLFPGKDPNRLFTHPNKKAVAEQSETQDKNKCVVS